MKLENQVTSLELSKRLKELGVKQESYFAWYEQNGVIELACQNNRGLFRFRDGAIIPPSHGKREYHSAFTVAELGEMLPMEIKHNEEWKKIEMWRSDVYDDWNIRYGNLSIQRGKTEADARAEMLIYLLENNLK